MDLRENRTTAFNFERIINCDTVLECRLDGAEPDNSLLLKKRLEILFWYEFEKACFSRLLQLLFSKKGRHLVQPHLIGFSKLYRN